MEREIKFRGKRIDNGLFIYGNLSIEFDGSCFISFWISKLTEPETNFYEPVQLSFEVDPKTVGQLTGLKDKNGKEIYEGDIIIGAYKQKSIVKWVEFYGEENFGDGMGYAGWNIDLYSGYPPKKHKLEIIGNIHQNEELLK